MKRRCVVALLAVMIASLVTGLAERPACAQEKNTIKVIGSKYCYFTVADWAGAFRTLSKNFVIDVKPGSVYSVTEALLNKEADAVMRFGRIDEDDKDEAQENGLELEEQIVGWGAVAFVTYRKNPVNAVTLDQIRKIFIGEITNWNDIGGEDLLIKVISRDEAVSGTHDFLVSSVLQGFPVGQNVLRTFDHDIMREVWKTKGAIADARYYEAMRGHRKGMLKVLAVKETPESSAVLPGISTVRDRTYPIVGPLTLYYDPVNVKIPARKFVQYCANRALSVVRFSKR